MKKILMIALCASLVMNAFGCATREVAEAYTVEWSNASEKDGSYGQSIPIDISNAEVYTIKDKYDGMILGKGFFPQYNFGDDELVITKYCYTDVTGNVHKKIYLPITYDASTIAIFDDKGNEVNIKSF